MSKAKKFFDPKTREFLVWDKKEGKWKSESISPTNVEELIYITDYVIAEVKIEAMIESQLNDFPFVDEKKFKKELHN
tara:strand:- start:426 stop:656 length:231 start_codon:yes stop_codon:yes gene_type:complete